MLGSRWTVHQRMAQRHPGEGQYEIITGSFGNPYVYHRGWSR